MEEQDLADRCRQGENSARQQLYERYAGRLFGICLRYVGDRAQAEDLLHDSFIQLFQSFDKFTWRGEGSLGAWMERVVVNLALQYLRRNEAQLHALPLDAVPDACDLSDTEMEAERVPSEVLMAMVRQLPVGYRTVFNLYVVEGKSHKEIARLLGIQEKSSASQLARAKSVLAEKLRKWMADNT